MSKNVFCVVQKCVLYIVIYGKICFYLLQNITILSKFFSPKILVVMIELKNCWKVKKKFIYVVQKCVLYIVIYGKNLFLQFSD
jgi:hypothetical protein